MITEAVSNCFSSSQDSPEWTSFTTLLSGAAKSGEPGRQRVVVNKPFEFHSCLTTTTKTNRRLLGTSIGLQHRIDENKNVNVLLRDKVYWWWLFETLCVCVYRGKDCAWLVWSQQSDPQASADGILFIPSLYLNHDHTQCIAELQVIQHASYHWLYFPMCIKLLL